MRAYDFNSLVDYFHVNPRDTWEGDVSKEEGGVN